MKASRCLVVALPAEARPIIRRFGLQRLQAPHPFPIHAGGDIALILSGVGKTRAARATALLARLNEHPAPLWINFGIAGHHSLPLGQAATARQITDVEQARTWTVEPVAFDDIPVVECRTVESPVSRYPDNAIYDMEAAGVAAALPPGHALRILKIVSDNAASSTQRINARFVRELCEARLDALESIAFEDPA